jgi:hypothetical protein
LFDKDVIPLSDSINNQELLSHIVPSFLDNKSHLLFDLKRW